MFFCRFRKSKSFSFLLNFFFFFSGIKKIKPINFPKRIDPGLSLAERIAERKNAQSLPELEHDYLYFDKFDKIDDLIDLNGHIIGMSLSPDQRLVACLKNFLFH